MLEKTVTDRNLSPFPVGSTLILKSCEYYTSHTMELWDIFYKQETLSPPISPLLLLCYVFLFCFFLCASLTCLKMWALDSNTSCLKLFHAGKLYLLGKLSELDAWQYQRLQHFNAAHLRELVDSLSGFKSLWLKAELYMNRQLSPRTTTFSKLLFFFFYSLCEHCCHGVPCNLPLPGRGNLRHIPRLLCSWEMCVIVSQESVGIPEG